MDWVTVDGKSGAQSQWKLTGAGHSGQRLAKRCAISSSNGAVCSRKKQAEHWTTDCVIRYHGGDTMHTRSAQSTPSHRCRFAA